MISLLVVNYRSAELAAEAIRTARLSTAEPLHVVVVDNSCDADEAARLRAHADDLVISTTNRGYAGAINDGRQRCSGDIVVVANPDVEFAPGAIDRLASAIGGDIAIAGPALYWDRDHRWHLPPAELSTTSERIDAVLASRSAIWRRRRDRRRIRRRVAFWSQREPRQVAAISGAVMAVRLRDFDAVGGFDERFALYFEEHDFVRRVAASGGRTLYVPDARCRHLYNQSAGQDGAAAAAHYAESERLYLAKWSGALAASVLKSLEREMPAEAAIDRSHPIALPRPGLLVEASPLASFETAAGQFPAGSTVEIPAEVATSFRGGALYLRIVEPERGRVLATYVRYGS